MNRGRVSTQVFLCFLIMMFLMATVGCSKSDDAPAPATTYTVTFDSQSATVAANPTSITVIPPETTVGILPTEPTLTSSNFAGWWTATSGGTEFTATTAVTASITVYARWTTNPVYTVTYNSDGGTAVDAQHVTLPATTVVTLPAAPTKIGYIFNSWNTQADGLGATFTGATTVTGNITVYAKWTSYNYTVTFDSQSATVAASPTFKAVASPATTVDALPTPPTKSGSTFAGWFTAVSGGGTEFTATTVVTADITVYAFWSANPVYTVTYDSQGGTAVAPQHVTSPATTVGTLPAAPTMTGYTFGGWYTAISGGGTSFTAGTTVTANITVYAKWTAIPATTFSQADLTGTWYMNNLRADKWMRAQISINSSGVATCNSMSDSGSGNTCPSPFDLTLTMNTSTGVITQTGANAANAGTDHMTMTSTKNLMVGTATNGSSGSYKYQLVILQKMGATYSTTDLNNISSFVDHQLGVGTGTNNEWRYGTGHTASDGEVWLDSEYTPSGPVTSGDLGDMGQKISVTTSGIVTISGKTTFEGFLSNDKRTIVGTDNDGSEYELLIIQIPETGQFTVGPLSAGIAYAHMLGGGSSFAGWIHATTTVASDGTVAFSDWADSWGGSAPSTTYTGHINDTSGTLIMTTGNPTYNGQISHDKKFIVATQTNDGYYFLNVTTK